MLKNLRNINGPRSEVPAIQRTEIFAIIRRHLDVEFSPDGALELIRRMSKEVDRWLTARWAVIHLANGNQRGHRSSEDEKDKVKRASQELVFCVIGRSLYGDAIDDDNVSDTWKPVNTDIWVRIFTHKSQVLSKLLGFYSQYTKLAVRVFEPVGEKKKLLFSSMPRAADQKAEILLKEWESFNLNIFSSAQQVRNTKRHAIAVKNVDEYL